MEFKFFDIEESQFEFPSYVRRRVSGEVLTFHSDPSSPSAEPTVGLISITKTWMKRSNVNIEGAGLGRAT